MLKGRQPGELFVKAFSGARGEGGASDFRMHFACLVDGQVNVEFRVKEQVCLGDNPSRIRRWMRPYRESPGHPLWFSAQLQKFTKSLVVGSHMSHQPGA